MVLVGAEVVYPQLIKPVFVGSFSYIVMVGSFRARA